MGGIHTVRLFFATLAALGLVLGEESRVSAPRGGGEPGRSRACLACHDMPEALSHPIGVLAPRITGLPLDAGGQMDCLTCHDDRTLRSEHREDRGPFLRRNARLLCVACHGVRLPPDSVAAHGLEIGRAHLRTGESGDEAELDRASRDCLACHDGTVARVPQVEIGRSLSSGWNRPHPVGVLFSGELRSDLLATIRLPGGRVACSSCHSVYARNKDMLVLPRLQSRLCLACHVK